MTEQEKRVHATHCCEVHGCKYCDDDCPVVSGEEWGIYCEQCEDDEDEDGEW